MTETEWRTCVDLEPMLEFLHGRASERKHRLFACGCSRQVWRWVSRKECQRAVEISEEYADGRASAKELRAAARKAAEAVSDLTLEAWNAMRMKKYAARDACATAELSAREHLDLLQVAAKVRATVASTDARPKCPCSLLRDLFGPTLFRSLQTDPSWFAWNGGIVTIITQAIYNDRRFGDLPILADALADAGCTNEHILNHCRERCEHFRGCWVIDLLLGMT
jgi:hypothetical protein